MSKKKQNNTPSSLKKLDRTQRLQSAKSWLKKYTGSNFIRAYRLRFGVDSLCAAMELKMIGCNIPDEIIERHKKQQQDIQKAKEKKRQIQSYIDYISGSDEYYFIAGYTAGGCPYGTRWDELSDEELLEISKEQKIPEKYLRQLNLKKPIWIVQQQILPLHGRSIEIITSADMFIALVTKH